MKSLVRRLERKLFPKKVENTFPEIVHPIKYPEGETEYSLFEYLNGFRLDGAISNELESYLKEDFRRFVYTLNLIPTMDVNASMLEIGSNPYFTSILLRKFTHYQLYHTNYFGGSQSRGVQVQKNNETGDIFEFKYINHNIENEDIPLDIKFDAILFCEVIEHLVNNPIDALLRIKNALKDGGVLVLTTPNVNRLENIARIIAGSNIYDPYSGYGPYGRHNREYNKHELHLLLSHLGFEIEEMFSSDVHENRSGVFYPIEKLAESINSIEHRRLDLGQYIFVRARNNGKAALCKPNWLYRSYPQSELCNGAS